MGILCHYDEIAVVPFLDFRIPLQRIRRTKANGMFPILKNSKPSRLLRTAILFAIIFSQAFIMKGFYEYYIILMGLFKINYATVFMIWNLGG